jgi:glyoxylase-like metal-dependent hydrolase (beta-lactamase superfamily II)/rhodanese-related sulfurtransferase
MYIQQLYTQCLSEAAYYIESNGEAAIIDPLRDIDAYVQLALERNATIKYIFETHFHADFVSGHLDLQKATNAPIIFGPHTQTAYPVIVAKDGESFALGAVELVAIHTPGHTLESTCWLLKDASEKAHALFTGDTLFIGDVGRPDLSSGQMGSEELAALLYHSLHTKLASLPDEVLVYPAHGAGSACGKNLGPEKFSTLGEQRQTNYALQPQTQEAFIKSVTEGLKEAPVYFAVNASINQQGYTGFDTIKNAALVPLEPSAFYEAIKADDTLVLDTRPATQFTGGFVPGSISIGLEGRMAEWAGSLLPFDKKIVLVAEPGKEEESITRLARVGFDKMAGYLKGGIEAWIQAGYPIDMVIDVEADELAMDLPFDDNLVVLDVRTEAEFGSGHIVGAMHLPLTDFTDVARMASLPENANLYVHCGGGYRSVIAASLLKQQGIHQVRNVLGGWTAIQEQEKIPVEKTKEVLN